MKNKVVLDVDIINKKDTKVINILTKRSITFQIFYYVLKNLKLWNILANSHKDISKEGLHFFHLQVWIWYLPINKTKCTTSEKNEVKSHFKKRTSCWVIGGIVSIFTDNQLCISNQNLEEA